MKYYRVISNTKIKGWCDEDSKEEVKKQFPTFYFREIPKEQMDEEIEDMGRQTWLKKT